jgi:hypothetical protein
MAPLSNKRKQKLKQRAAAQTARENAGAGAAAKAAIGQANRDYGREVASARGAQKVEVSQLTNMLKGIGDSGLKGRYAAQTVADLRGRKMSAISSVPFAIADANAARRDAVASARSDIAEAQIQRQQDFGENYSSLLEDARKAKEDRLSSDESGPGGISTGVRNALIVANNYLNAADAKGGGAAGILMQDRGAFAQGVAKDAEGADQVDALKAVNILIKRREHSAAKGSLESLYGPGSMTPKRKKKRG